MVDFHACTWPRPDLNADDTSLALYFDAMNDEPLWPLLSDLSLPSQLGKAITDGSAEHLGIEQQSQQQQQQSRQEEQVFNQLLQQMKFVDANRDSISGRSPPGPQQRSPRSLDVGRTERSPSNCAGSSAADGRADPSSGSQAPKSGSQDPKMAERPPVITFSHYLPYQVTHASCPALRYWRMTSSMVDLIRC